MIESPIDMSYFLEEVISWNGNFKKWDDLITDSKVVSLKYDLEMFPLTENLIDSILDLHGSNLIDSKNNMDRFIYAIGRTLAPNEGGFILIDCFGGTCFWKGSFWNNGDLIFGPLEEVGHTPHNDSPVNRVLQLLAVPTNSYQDPFTLAGLTMCRNHGEWLQK